MATHIILVLVQLQVLGWHSTPYGLQGKHTLTKFIEQSIIVLSLQWLALNLQLLNVGDDK